ncbi:hypothetical protein RsTz2092_12980 [Deferribacterales bacterium RsTz2092]|nr:hypothetical protein AGMMS49941_11280 [Deferribacterales bacterium]
MVIIYKDIVDKLAELGALDVSVALAFDDELGRVEITRFDGQFMKIDDDGENGYYLTGEMECRLDTLCDRCGEPAKVLFNVSVNMPIEPSGMPVGGSDSEVSDSEGDIFYSGAESLDIDELLRQEVLLNLPVKRLCSENCRNTVLDEIVAKGAGDGWHSGLSTLKDVLGLKQAK